MARFFFLNLHNRRKIDHHWVDEVAGATFVSERLRRGPRWRRNKRKDTQVWNPGFQATVDLVRVAVVMAERYIKPRFLHSLFFEGLAALSILSFICCSNASSRSLKNVRAFLLAQ